MPATTHTIAALLLLLTPILAAQSPQAPQGPQPIPEDLLAEIQADVQTYYRTLPSLFADERFLSQRFNDGHLQDTRVTLSTFRVLRPSTPADAKHPRESRTVREVDGVPAHGDRVKGPYTLDGGFDAALRVLLPESVPCFDLRLAPDPTPDPAHLHLLLTAHAQLPATCPASAAGRTGDITLDRSSRQVLLIHQTVPHPNGGGDAWSPLLWTVTFAPVSLAGKTFYTPQTVQTELHHRGSSESMRSTAQYSNYGKLEVTSTILPIPATQP